MTAVESTRSPRGETHAGILLVQPRVMGVRVRHSREGHRPRSRRFGGVPSFTRAAQAKRLSKESISLSSATVYPNSSQVKVWLLEW